MFAEFDRDAAGTAAVFGLFAISWFGWSLERPPAAWRVLGVVGMVIAAVLGIGAAIWTWQLWSAGSVIDSRTGPLFGIIVGVEFAIAGIGAGVLARLGRADYIPAWIALVVGLHFIPLGIVLEQPFLYVVATTVSVLAIGSAVAAPRAGVAISFLNGITVGAALLVSGAASVVALIVR